MNKQNMLLMSMLPVAALSAADKPNVVMVYTDEHNFRTIGAYLPLLGDAQRYQWGEQAKLETPNLNYLAENGVIMNNCYVSTPVSTPSRASMMTGMYTQKTNCTMNDLALNRSLKTFAQCFSENGYETGYVGKWHLSGSAKPGWVPDPNYGWKENTYMFNRGHYKSIKDNGNANPMIGVGLLDGYDFMTDYLTDKAIDYINRNKENPFLLCLSIPDPHGPNVAAKEYYNQYADVTFNKPATAGKDMSQYPSWATGNTTLTQNDFRNYWGMVKCIDDNIGRLVNVLRENNQLDNTIIIFTSDHGDMCGEHGRVDKSIPLEASMKVPFIMYAPNMLPKGHVVQEAVSNIDVYPTLVELCGLTGAPEVDGISIVPLLKNQEGYHGRNCVFSRSTGGNTGWLAVTTDRYKLVVSSKETDVPWLGDKETDPDELVNYYSDPAYADVVADLEARLIKYCEENAEPKFTNNVIRAALGLEPIGGGNIPETGENLLVNGDFEKTIDVDGIVLPEKWETYSSVAKGVNVGQNGIGKSNSLKFGLQGSAPECRARQTIEVEPGKTYKFSGYCYYSATPSGGKTASIKVLDSEDNLVYTYQIPATGTMGSTVTANDATVVRTFEFEAPTTVVSIVLENNKIDKLIRFDNLSVWEDNGSSSVSGLQADGTDLVDIRNNSLILKPGVKMAQVFTTSGQIAGVITSGAGTYSMSDYPSGVLFVKAVADTGDVAVIKVIK